MRRRTIIILSVLALLGIAGAVAVRARAAKPPVVTTEEARVGTLRSTVVETGSVESANEVQILPLVSARVADVLVEEGAAVEAGTVLVTLDDTNAAARVNVAKASVARAEAALALQLRGAKPEEVRAQETAIANAQTALAKAKALLDASLASASSDASGTAASVSAAQERVDTVAAKQRDARATTRADLAALDTQVNAAEENIDRLESQLNDREDSIDARSDAARVARDNAAESVDAAQAALDAAAGSPPDVLAKLEEALRQARAAFRVAQANLSSTEKAGALELAQAESQLTAAEEQRDLLRAQRSASVAKADATLNDLANSLDQASKDLATAQATAASQRANAEVKRRTAESSYTQAQAQLASAQAQLATLTRTLTDVDLGVARADLASAEAQLEDARATQQNYVLTAPIDGVVTHLDATIGETVGPQTLVARVTDYAALQIVMNISETEIASVEIGQAASVTFDAFGEDEVFRGAVVSIDIGPTIQQGVIFYQTRVRFDEGTPVDALRPAMTATVTITTRETASALIIPSRAVNRADGATTVRVQRDDGMLEVRTITLGERGDDGVAVTSGLEAGERVVTYEKDA